ncbi:MAG: formylglycine-generating enzyme family protein [Chloroflexi bacterium]|nr:formylglycine-generating enzyme family protein [Chloroflexota bacterium]
MSNRHTMIAVMIFFLMLSGCGKAELKATPVPSITMAVLPTATPLVTLTSIPPTATSDSSAVPISLVDSGQQLGSAHSWDVSLGDLDGDGDLDAFVVNGSQGEAASAVWLNDGYGVFTIGERRLGYGMGVELGDLDGDGDLDAFVTDWDKASEVWLNEGGVQGGMPGTFTDSGQRLGSDSGFDVALGDLDGDGDLDAVIAQEKINTVWLNDGEGSFADTGQALGVAITAAVVLGDLDDDGDLDALTGGWDEPAKVWLNDGTGLFTDSSHNLSPASVHIHGLALGDVDGDGDLDAFLAIASGDPNQVWLNSGSGTFSNSGQRLAGSLAHAVSLGDLDGDGDLDAFVAHGDPWRGSSDTVWLNEGGTFTDSDLRLGDLASYGVGLGDLDNDGDLDALVAHSDWQDTEEGIPNQVWLNETHHPSAATTSTAPAVLGDVRTRPADGAAMVYVPGGTFQMGSTDAQVAAESAQCERNPVNWAYCERRFYEHESPQHTVTLDGFWLDRTEVTNAQYARCVQDESCRESRLADDPTYNGADYPVAGIPWQDAAVYCTWAGGRLPAEAEWEYAARGTTGYIYPWGDAFDCAGGNLSDDLTQCDDGYAHTAPVGSFPGGSSWSGALDMTGNVWEWVADKYGGYVPTAQTNPTGPVEGDRHILRGGSWGYGQNGVRAAYRYLVPPSADYLGVGFRCVVSLATPETSASVPESSSAPPADGNLDDTWSRPTDGMTMVYVPSGEFEMGSTDAGVDAAVELCRQYYDICNYGYYALESPQHTVVLDHFWMDQTEVTNAQYQQCVDVGVCQSPGVCERGEPPPQTTPGADHPVVCVTWDEAQTYCEWAGARLPTEAEWEYAARGTGGNVYPWGNTFDGTLLNYCDVNCDKPLANTAVDDGYAQSAPVGSYPRGASWCGALDLSGNVFEWTTDWLGNYSSVAHVNPTGPEAGSEKVVRGGGWHYHQASLRGVARAKIAPDRRYNPLGFRCVISLDK